MDESLLRAELRWFDALVHNRPGNAVLTSASPEGGRLLEAIRRGEVEVESIAVSERATSHHGAAADVAAVSGRGCWQYRVGGISRPGEFHHAMIWIRAGDGWRLAWVDVTPLSPE